jgi:hypothetical protein
MDLALYRNRPLRRRSKAIADRTVLDCRRKSGSLLARAVDQRVRHGDEPDLVLHRRQVQLVLRFRRDHRDPRRIDRDRGRRHAAEAQRRRRCDLLPRRRPRPVACRGLCKKKIAFCRQTNPLGLGLVIRAVNRLRRLCTTVAGCFVPGLPRRAGEQGIFDKIHNRPSAARAVRVGGSACI